MRPTIAGVDARAVAELRRAVPELEDRYLELVDIYEDDLGADVVFGELADLVDDIVLGQDDRPGRPARTAAGESLLERCLEVVEAVAETGDPDADEVVGYYFLDQLSAGTTARITSRLGEHTLDLLGRLDAGDLGESDGKSPP